MTELIAETVIVTVRLGNKLHILKNSFTLIRFMYCFYFLMFISFHQMTTKCSCEGAILFSESLISDNRTSVLSLTERSNHHSTLSRHMNLYTMATAVASHDGTDSMHIIRDNSGDIFIDEYQKWSSCSADKCISRSSGTASIAVDFNDNNDAPKSPLNRYSGNLCYCRCLPNFSSFREDMHICVNDVHECALVTFVSGNVHQRIPYVFLPLRGQIVYPNAEIHFDGLKSVPTCIISRVRYLTRSGWNEMKNYSFHGAENVIVPFKLFHDERQVFIQWLGDAELRASLTGRLILMDLICKEKDTQLIFTPCLSFRVAGVPSSKSVLIEDNNDESASNNKSTKFSSSEYIALGLATLLLALIYIASVFLYLHFKKNKLEKSTRRGNAFQKCDIEDNASHLFGENQSKKLIVEEGLIKNNPLLMKRYYPTSVAENANGSHVDRSRLEEKPFCSLTSDNEKISTSEDASNEIQNKVSAIVHPRINEIPSNIKRFEKNEQQKWQIFTNRSLLNPLQHMIPKNENNLVLKKSYFKPQQQFETNNIEERHPDENISIVEYPEDIKTNSKHKLYFNPAYFEPELLMAPPPAAVEFLSKIREVMTVAKRKMSMKKFLPSLTQIPEEHQSYEESKCSFDNIAISLASRENENSHEEDKKMTRNFTSPESTEHRINENKEKRQIIQKWLQSIPPMSQEMCSHKPAFKNTNDGEMKRKMHYEYNGNVQNKPCNESNTANQNSRTKDINLPLKNFHHENSKTNENPLKINTDTKDSPPAIPKRDSSNQSRPTIPRRKQSINLNDKFSSHCPHKNAIDDLDILDEPKISDVQDDCENDIPLNVTLRSTNNNFNSSLPLDEELTMHNAIYNVVTGSTTLSKLKLRYETFKNEAVTRGNDTTALDDKHDMDGKYSLVTEVYVNDGYDSSETSSTSLNFCNESKIDVQKSSNSLQRNTESGRLMIQLADCPFFYSVDNADDFEPDTLDRKQNKENENDTLSSQRNFVDSLERPAISLRTYGSFRQDSSHCFNNNGSNLRKNFGSLQEIYESRRKSEVENARLPSAVVEDDSPRSLSSHLENMLWRKNKFESRHRYRQRKLSPPPPLPQSCATSLSYATRIMRPPLPPRKDEANALSDLKKSKFQIDYNENSNNKLNLPRFLSDSNLINGNELNVCFNNRNIWTYRPEDSGYLSSSDSDKSKYSLKKGPSIHCCAIMEGVQKSNEDDNNDDDDDSLSCCNDGNSESGAESIETNFKFYNNRKKPTRENFEDKDIIST